MGMGTFNRRRAYQQQDPMRNAGSLMGLLGLKSKEMQNLTNAVEAQGQSMAREKVANLINTPEYAKMDPQQAQAAILGLTQGRNLGDRGKQILGQTYGNKGEIQNNNWKKDAATTLFGRQLKRDAISNANAIRRAQISAANRNNRQDVSGNDKVRKAYMELISKTKNPAERTKLVQEGFLNGAFDKNDRIGMEKLGIIGQGLGGNTKPKFDNTKLYRQQSPEVRNFINSKYGNEVYEGNDGYYFRGKKLTPLLLRKLAQGK